MRGCVGAGVDHYRHLHTGDVDVLALVPTSRRLWVPAPEAGRGFGFGNYFGFYSRFCL